MKPFSYPDFSLEGKKVVITGAGKGIGRGLALGLAHAGAEVALIARSSADLETVVAEVAAEGGRARAYVADLRDIPGIEGLFSRMIGDLGGLDVLVNNAGLGQPVASVDVDEAYWDHMMSLNLKATFFCSRAAGRHMLATGEGVIVNMSSQASLAAIPEESVYCTSKAGINMLTKSLALEWGPRGIRVNAVAPTFVRTPGTAERLDTPDFRANVLSRIPLGRVGTLTDVVAAVQYLASPAGSMVNGEVLVVDGGWTVQ
jgi:NAD(P)-dependent dehydrogenase (short-subunit alcohol dehydrogenase family)